MFKKKSLTLACVLLSACIHAQVHSDYSITTKSFKQLSSFDVQVQPDIEDAALDLYVSNPGKKNLQLLLSHQVDGILLDTTIKSEKYIRRYLFDQALDGQYQLTIKSGKEVVTKEIQLSTITTRNISVH